MISIIGAGPSGCYAAYLLAKTGREVQIFEEHKEIGKPIQCTGLVTQSIKEHLNLKNSLILNKIEKVRILSKNNSLELKLKNKNIILDRKEFDNYLADQAINQGARIFLNYRFIENKNNLIKLRYDQKKETILKTDHLIGADGPISQVARSNNLNKKQKLLIGLQAITKLKNNNFIEFYPDVGCFAWIVPENEEICRIGVASYTNPKDHLKRLLKQKKIKKNSIVEKQAGLIPIYNPKQKTQKNNIYLLGDAASQVKATTGGGIIQGLKAAESLSDSITNNKNYEKEWKKKIGRDLWLHLKMRNIMDYFKEKDWDILIKLFKEKETKKIIENFDRDYPSKFILNLLLQEPKLFYSSKVILNMLLK